MINELEQGTKPEIYNYDLQYAKAKVAYLLQTQNEKELELVINHL